MHTAPQNTNVPVTQRTGVHHQVPTSPILCHKTHTLWSQAEHVPVSVHQLVHTTHQLSSQANDLKIRICGTWWASFTPVNSFRPIAHLAAIQDKAVQPASAPSVSAGSDRYIVCTATHTHSRSACTGPYMAKSRDM